GWWSVKYVFCPSLNFAWFEVRLARFDLPLFMASLENPAPPVILNLWFRAASYYRQRPCMRCVPPYISHYQNSAFCVSVQVPEKLSEELITIKDAEPARSQ
ncbi:MAG: hypothetical protein WAU36_09180, partial [Cyclobacteriaceae bacterium]